MAKKKLSAKDKRQSRIDAYFSDGDDSLVRDVAKRREQVDSVADTPERADFSGVSSRVLEAPEQERPGFLSNLSFGNLTDAIEDTGIADILGSGIDKAQSGLAQTAAGGIQKGLDAEYFDAREREKPWYNRDLGLMATDAVKAATGLDLDWGPGGRAKLDLGINTLLTGRNPYSEDSFANANAAMDDLLKRSATNDAEAKQVLDQVGFGHGVVEAYQDFANSPESLASILGGPMAVLPAASAYNREYLAARKGGVNPTEADKRARKQMEIEFAFEAIPVGKLANIIGGKAAKSMVRNTAYDAALKIGRTSVGEAATEGLTTMAQLAADSELANDENASDEARKFAQSNIPKTTTEYWNQVWRASKAGAFGGGAIATPMATIQAVSEAGRRAGEITSAVDQGKRRGELVDELNNSIDVARSNELLGYDEEEQAARKAIKDRDYDRAVRQVEEQRARSLDEQMIDEGTRELQDSGRADSGNLMADAFRRAGVGRGNFGPAPVAPVDPRASATDTGTQAGPMLDTTEADKAIKDEAAAIRKKALELRGRARNDYKKAQLEETRSLTPEQRQVRLATAMNTWDAENPLAAFETVASQPAPKKKGKAKAQSMSAADFGKAMQGLSIPDRASNPLASAAGETTGVTLDDVGKALTKNAGSAGSGRIAGLARTGNVNFVRTVGDIVEVDGLMEAGSGFYDPKSGKIYVVADKLNPNDIKGDVLGILAHEVKHGADISGSKSLRGSFKNLVGDKANTAINSQIRNLAKQATPEGKRAKQIIDLMEDKYDQSDWDLELPALYLQDQRNAKNGIVRNIVSAVRTKYKSVTGNDDLNIKDIAYVADRLVDEVAMTGERFEGMEIDPKSTIISGGRGAYTALKEGRTYLSADGTRKYEISDHESRLTLPPDLKTGVEYRAAEVIQHPKLFAEFPRLAELPVIFTDMSGISGEADNYGAAFVNPNDTFPEGAIQINNKYVGANPNRFGSQTHKYMIHELQHAAQYQGGTTGGTSPEALLSQHGQKLKRKITELQQSLNAAKQLGADRDHIFSIEDELEDTKTMYEDEYDKAVKDYKKVLGEQEAYDTVDRLSLTEDERGEDTYRIGKNREDAYVAKEGRISTERGKTLKAAAKAEPKVEEKKAEPRSTPMASLSIPRDMEDLEEAGSVAWRMTKRLFTPTMGYGHELNELRQHTRSLIASEAAKAEDLGRGLAKAIQDNVKATGIREDQLRADIEKIVDEIDALPNPVNRQARMDALERKYPGVGKALNQLRDFKWQLTRELIALRARDPKDLTEKELAVYQKAIERAETYSTRAYLSTLGGDSAKDYSKRLLKKAKKNPNSPEGKKVAAAVEWLVNNQLTIPRLPELQNMSMDSLRRLHAYWIGPSDNFRGGKGKATMIDRLDALERMARPELEARAMDVVKELVGQTPEKGAIARYYAGGRQNRTVLQTRKDIPKELRAVMGEITDPYLREMLSVARMTQLMGKTKMLTQVFENGGGRWWSDTKRDGFEQRLSGEAYGPLDGKYVNKDVYDMISDVTVYQANMDQVLADVMHKPTVLTQMAAGATLPVISKIAGLQKTAQIVLSPAAMAFNLAGALTMILPQNGIIPFTKHGNRGMKNAMSVVHATAFKHQNEEALRNAREVLLAGVMDSATVGEFQGKVYQDIFADIKRLSEDDPNYVQKAMRIVSNAFGGTHKGVNYLREVYAFMDVWAKVATYYDRKEFLTEYYKANGTPKTEEEIIRQAGYEANATNISYTMAIPAARLLERNVPVLTMFLTYFSEVPRSIAFSYMQVYKDSQLAMNANTPKAKALATAQAMKRFIGTSLVTGGLTAAVVSALDNEDEKEKRRRKLDPGWERTNIRFSMGHDEKGNEVGFGLGRLDPNGPLNEAVRTVIAAPKGERAEAMAESVKNLFVKSESIIRAFQLLADAANAGIGNRENDMARKKNTLIERNYPNFYNSVSNFLSAGDIGENLLATMEMFIPAPIAGAMDPARTPTTKEAPGATTTARLLGYKAYTRDPDKNLTFRARDYNDALKDLKADRKDLFDRLPGMEVNELIGEINDLTQAEQKAFDDLSEAVDGYTAYDKKTLTGVYNILNGEKLPKEVVAGVRYGRFAPTVVTHKVINDWYKDNIKLAKTPEDRAEVLQQRNMLIRAYAGKEE